MSVRGGQGGGRGGHSGRGSRGRDRGSSHYIPTLNKIKVYEVYLETKSLIMFRGVADQMRMTWEKIVYHVGTIY